MKVTLLCPPLRGYRSADRAVDFPRSKVVGGHPQCLSLRLESVFWVSCSSSSHLCSHILATMFIILYEQLYFSILVC